MQINSRKITGFNTSNRVRVDAAGSVDVRSLSYSRTLGVREPGALAISFDSANSRRVRIEFTAEETKAISNFLNRMDGA